MFLKEKNLLNVRNGSRRIIQHSLKSSMGTLRMKRTRKANRLLAVRKIRERRRLASLQIKRRKCVSLSRSAVVRKPSAASSAWILMDVT